MKWVDWATCWFAVLDKPKVNSIDLSLGTNSRVPQSHTLNFVNSYSSIINSIPFIVMVNERQIWSLGLLEF